VLEKVKVPELVLEMEKVKVPELELVMEKVLEKG
jgi:hypothetical protein